MQTTPTSINWKTVMHPPCLLYTSNCLCLYNCFQNEPFDVDTAGIVFCFLIPFPLSLFYLILSILVKKTMEQSCLFYASFLSVTENFPY